MPHTTRKLHATLPAALLLSAALALPAPAALAQTGGAETPSGGNADPDALPVPGGVALKAPAGVILGRSIPLRGRGPGGRTVLVQREVAPGEWSTVVSTQVRPDGTIRASWRTTRAGRFMLRGVIRDARSSQAPAEAPTPARVTVYSPALSTYYGPGFWGNRTACGQRLERETLGVAHRTLRCGTKVEFFYGGRSIVVPVIDRGPYSAATWDLTMATATALGLRYTDRVGWLGVGRVRY
jgi:peptidoglycan lytic transglycosylase